MIADQKVFTILSLNVNSWIPHREGLLEQANVLAIQEIWLTAKGQHDEQKLLSSKKFTAVFGQPCPQNTIYKNGVRQKATSSTGVGRQGGVAITASELFIVTNRTFDINPLFQSSRWVRAAVPLGNTGALSKKFLHIISFYNLSGRDRTNRNRYLERVLSDAAQIGQQPTIICTDANTKVESSHALTIAIRSGRWTDLGSHFTDNKPEQTFSSSNDWDQFSWTNASRPDYVWQIRRRCHSLSVFVSDVTSRPRVTWALKLQSEPILLSKLFEPSSCLPLFSCQQFFCLIKTGTRSLNLLYVSTLKSFIKLVLLIQTRRGHHLEKLPSPTFVGVAVP